MNLNEIPHLTDAELDAQAAGFCWTCRYSVWGSGRSGYQAIRPMRLSAVQVKRHLERGHEVREKGEEHER